MWKKEDIRVAQKNVGDFSKNVGVFSENVGDFPKNVGRFSRTVGVFLDASEMITAAPANFFQQAELFIVKKVFNGIPHACACAHTTAILHFLLSQPSQISV